MEKGLGNSDFSATMIELELRLKLSAIGMLSAIEFHKATGGPPPSCTSFKLALPLKAAGLTLGRSAPVVARDTFLMACLRLSSCFLCSSKRKLTLLGLLKTRLLGMASFEDMFAHDFLRKQMLPCLAYWAAVVSGLQPRVLQGVIGQYFFRLRS